MFARAGRVRGAEKIGQRRRCIEPSVCRGLGQLERESRACTLGRHALFRIETLKVPLPQIKLQRAFIQRFSAVASLAAEQHKSQSRLDNLFASLQYRAFRGER